MIKVLIVDDSALIRSLLSEIVSRESDMVLVGAAPDAYVARDLVNKHAPDVITLDIEMPKVDGLAFLEKLMRARPTSVLMISTLTEAGAEATIRALELGAIDYIAKPKIGVAEGIREFQELIVNKIRIAAQANVKRLKKPPTSVLSQAPITGTEKLWQLVPQRGEPKRSKKYSWPFLQTVQPLLLPSICRQASLRRLLNAWIACVK